MLQDVDNLISSNVFTHLKISHSAKDPHGGVVEDGGVAVSGRRAVHRPALGHEVPRLDL